MTSVATTDAVNSPEPAPATRHGPSLDQDLGPVTGGKRPSAMASFRTVLDWAIGLIMFVLFVAVLVQVGARYMLNFSFAWSEEFPVLLFAWLVYLGSAGALAEGRHLGITFVQDWFPAPVRWVVRILIDVLVLAFLVFAVITGIQLTQIFGHYSFVALPFSRYWFFLAVPVGCLLMLPAAIRILLDHWRGERVPLTEKKQQKHIRKQIEKQRYLN